MQHASGGPDRIWYGPRRQSYSEQLRPQSSGNVSRQQSPVLASGQWEGSMLRRRSGSNSEGNWVTKMWTHQMLPWCELWSDG